LHLLQTTPGSQTLHAICSDDLLGVNISSFVKRSAAMTAMQINANFAASMVLSEVEGLSDFSITSSRVRLIQFLHCMRLFRH
jgi:hypothetical protein